MNLIERFFSLPLLAKDLLEQAQNPRTYLLRVVYALMLYGAALFHYADLNNSGAAAGLASLGRGREFFQLLVNVQTLAILLLLPAMTCGALTVEKEKDTLALLLLTKLSPRTIIVEKFLSRLLAMGTYQLLSLPLFAIVYGMGGVELSGILWAVGGLFCLTIVVASVSILCSTWFRTTAEAFMMAYGGLVVLSGFLFIPVMMLRQMQYARNPGFQSGFPPAGLQENGSVVRIAVGIQALIFSAVFLGIAARVLVPRAFVPARNLILEWFQFLDRFFNELNEHTTGGVVLIPDGETLPSFQPVAWRETRKKSLGTFRYQFRILMLLLAPLVLVIAHFMTDGRNDFSSPFRGFPVFFWSVTVICLIIHSTGVIASERIRQTLDVLLVTPMKSDDIVLAKLSGVRRLIKIRSVPFVVLIGFQGIWTGYVVNRSRFTNDPNFWLELVPATLGMMIYMPVMMWIGFQFGLRLRTQMQAVLATLATVAAICLLPLQLAVLSDVYGLPGLRWIRLLSPLLTLFSSFNGGVSREFQRLQWPDWVLWSAVALIIHFFIYGIIWWQLRRNATKSFSRIVHRSEK